VTPTAAGELLLDVTLVLGNGQITAHGIEEPPDNAGTIAITGEPAATSPLAARFASATTARARPSCK
jgi:hypothetical protein